MGDNVSKNKNINEHVSEIYNKQNGRNPNECSTYNSEENNHKSDKRNMQEVLSKYRAQLLESNSMRNKPKTLNSNSNSIKTTTNTNNNSRKCVLVQVTGPNSTSSQTDKVHLIHSSSQTTDSNEQTDMKNFIINIHIDLVSCILFLIALSTRIYRLATPNNIVFDELHYGKYISLYMKNTFFFDQHPPFGKQLIAGVAHLSGFDGNYTFSRIGAEYTTNVPIFWLRFIPALCGSLLSPIIYELLIEMKVNRWISLLGGLLIILDNSLLTQSRFILMESMLLLFSFAGLLYLLRFQKSQFASMKWLFYGTLSAIFFTFALSIKYVGFYSCCLAFFIMIKYLWDLLHDDKISDFQIILEGISRGLLFTIIPIGIYLSIFYIHLNILYKAGPHDSAMTSAFQASLDGGLASITKGQPLNVVHGSQITLRHTHGRACWMHSHAHVYPVRYSDKRGSSYQQQVTCYSFKDVNNWWIIKRPEKDDLVVGEDPDPIQHGDIIQLVHGITSRALNSHDVAAPVTPQCQEVSCYIDYNISMAGQLLWQLDILNRDVEGPIWHAIRSEIRLIHLSTNTALRFSGKQLPEWGFNQHEIVSDRIHEQQDTIWNVEEHRYTKTDDSKERERQLLNAEMIPIQRTRLSFWDKFVELQSKMLWHTDQVASHMYSSEVFEWPWLDKGIAYWVDKTSNGQIHLLGNILIWYSGTISIFIYCILLLIYMMRRKRLCYDISPNEWEKFTRIGQIFLFGYIIHYIPYFFVERILFLHNYIPAFVFKLLVLCCVIEHCDYIVCKIIRWKLLIIIYRGLLFGWIIGIIWIYVKFLALSYGIEKLTSDDIINLRWKDSWDFIMHKDLP